MTIVSARPGPTEMSAQSTPTSAYFDNSYVAELKQSGFLDSIWK